MEHIDDDGEPPPIDPRRLVSLLAAADEIYRRLPKIYIDECEATNGVLSEASMAVINCFLHTTSRDFTS